MHGLQGGGQVYDVCRRLIRLASMGVSGWLISAQSHRRFTVVVGLVFSPVTTCLGSVAIVGLITIGAYPEQRD